MAGGLPGTLIGAGRNTDVYDIGDGRVLRRYRDGREARRVTLEARIMMHARAFGVPVPEVFEVSGPDIVMEHVVGPTMLDALARRPWTFRRQARLLARLHSLVHQVPAIPELRAPCGDEDGDRQVLLHMDLHPQNMILSGTGPVLTRVLQGAFARSFAHAAGPIDRAWRATAIRHRLDDRNLLPAERSRLERLPPG